MKKQMKRTVYEAPVTERFQVELEANLMTASIVVREERGDVTTEGHELFDKDLSEETWNTGAASEWQ